MRGTPEVAVRHNLLAMADECLEWCERKEGTKERRKELLDVVFWLTYNVGHWNDK